jgi:WD40 repeat protein
VKTGELIRSSWCRVIDVLDPDTGSKKEPLRPAASTRMINAITFLDNGNKLVAFWSSNGGREHRVTVWSWPAREPLTRFSHSCEFVYDIAASPDGKLLALPNGKNGVAVYNSASGERARVVGTAPICGLCFTAAGNMLIGGSEDGAHLHLWDSGTGAERGRISTGRSEDWLFHVDVSSDGRYLAAVTGKDILMWDLERLL